MKKTGIIIAATALVIGGSAYAQDRVRAPQPASQPGFQPADIDPIMAKLNALQSQLNVLNQSAGRQVVTLHFAAGQSPGMADNNSNTYQEQARLLCEMQLKDRYGRVLSYRLQYTNNMYYFSHVLCETKP